MELSKNINHLVFIVDNDLISISALNTDDREAIESIYYLYGVYLYGIYLLFIWSPLNKLSKHSEHDVVGMADATFDNSGAIL